MKKINTIALSTLLALTTLATANGSFANPVEGPYCEAVKQFIKNSNRMNTAALQNLYCSDQTNENDGSLTIILKQHNNNDESAAVALYSLKIQDLIKVR